jgi:hypothetical protein
MNANLKRKVGQLKSAKLAPKNLKPLILDIPNKLVERADQVLLGLSHTRESIPLLLKQTLTRIENNPNDLVGRVGRQVLERAEIVRKQLIEKAEDSGSRVNARWVPEWLKEMSFAPTARTVDGAPTARTVDGAPTARTGEGAPTAVEAAPIKASPVKAGSIEETTEKSAKPRKTKARPRKAKPSIKA